MTISVERAGLADAELADRVEKMIRDCIGERPSEEWKVGIKLSSRCCEVCVKGPVQTRSETIYDEGPKLPEKIAAWLSLYPLT